MCYSNCPAENWDGECQGIRKAGTAAHCYVPTCDCGAELEDGKCPDCEEEENEGD